MKRLLYLLSYSARCQVQRDPPGQPLTRVPSDQLRIGLFRSFFHGDLRTAAHVSPRAPADLDFLQQSFSSVPSTVAEGQQGLGLPEW